MRLAAAAALTLLAAEGARAQVEIKTAAVDWAATMSDPEKRAMEASAGTLITFTWTGNHNVYKMASKEAFDACDFTGAVEVGSQSPTLVNYAGAEAAYYACEVGSHCRNGQKLAVSPPPMTTTTTTTDEKAKLVDVHLFSDAKCTTEWAAGIPPTPHASVSSGSCFGIGVSSSEVMSVKLEVQPGDEVAHLGVAYGSCGAAKVNAELNCKLDHSQCCAVSNVNGLIFAYKTMLHDHSSHDHGDHGTPATTPTSTTEHGHDHDHDGHDHGTPAATSTSTAATAKAPLNSGVASTTALFVGAAAAAAAAVLA